VGCQSWRIYKRLLGYSARYWPIGLIALVGMLLDGGGWRFLPTAKPMIDDLFAKKDAYLIFWMPIWIMGIFFVRCCGTFVSDYGISYIGRHVVQTMQHDVFGPI
jgi:subfamily B ATP-binding cassette protein MsbA